MDDTIFEFSPEATMETMTLDIDCASFVSGYCVRYRAGCRGALCMYAKFKVSDPPPNLVGNILARAFPGRIPF